MSDLQEIEKFNETNLSYSRIHI